MGMKLSSERYRPVHMLQVRPAYGELTAEESSRVVDVATLSWYVLDDSNHTEHPPNLESRQIILSLEVIQGPGGSNLQQEEDCRAEIYFVDAQQHEHH